MVFWWKSLGVKGPLLVVTKQLKVFKGGLQGRIWIVRADVVPHWWRWGKSDKVTVIDNVAQ